MELNVTSSVITGVYTVLEVLLFFLFIFFVRLILICSNIKSIYVCQAPVHLTSTRFSLFAEFGLASRSLTCLAALLTTVFVALSTAGSFAIVGETRPVYTPITVAIKVVRATPARHLDLLNHVAIADGLVSPSFALITFSSCLSASIDKTTYFAVYNGFPDATTIGVDLSTTAIDNSTCVTRTSGYRQEQIIELPRSEPSGSDLARQCFLVSNIDATIGGQVRQLNDSEYKGRFAPQCQGQPVEAWCSTFVRHVCLVTFEFESFFMEIAYVTKPTGSFFSDKIPSQEKVDSNVLRSMSFLLDVGSWSMARARLAGHSTVIQNGTVWRKVGERGVTVFNVKLLAGTTGLMVGMTVLSGVIAAWGWILYIWKGGRRGYNSFNSSLEALSCVMVELKSRRGQGLEKSGRYVPLVLRDGKIDLLD